MSKDDKKTGLIESFPISVHFPLLPIDKGFPFSFMNVWWSNFFQLISKALFLFEKVFSYLIPNTFIKKETTSSGALL